MTLPATRIACLILLAAGIATARMSSLESRLALGLLCLAVLLATRPRARFLLKRLVPALLGVGLLLLPLGLSVNSERAVEVILRAAGAVTITTLVASTVELPELGKALGMLGAPAELTSLVHTLLWQLGNVGAEGKRLLLARQLRGARGFGPEMLAQLLVRTAARAERVDLALRLRGPGGGADESGQRFGVRDAAALATVCASLVALHWLGRRLG